MVNEPFESVVTITTAESVVGLPSASVVVQVVVYVVNGAPEEAASGYWEVVVVKTPAESVSTITTPDSVAGFPSESVVVHVVV